MTYQNGRRALTRLVKSADCLDRLKYTRDDDDHEASGVIWDILLSPLLRTSLRKPFLGGSYEGSRPDPTREKNPNTKFIGEAMGGNSNLCTIRSLSRMAYTVKDRRASESSPEGGYRLDPHTPIETTEQLRIAIDQGTAGDKVDVADPAAAPLGTDDEAGGTPNSTAQVRAAAAHEVRARPSSKRQRTSGLGAAWWLIAFTLFTGAAIVASVYFLRL
jgi:hypothetical protein